VENGQRRTESGKVQKGEGQYKGLEGKITSKAFEGLQARGDRG